MNSLKQNNSEKNFSELIFDYLKSIRIESISKLVGVSPRAIRYWMEGENPPKPGKTEVVQNLIIVFLYKGLFEKGKEKILAQELWEAAKPRDLFLDDWFDEVLNQWKNSISIKEVLILVERQKKDQDEKYVIKDNFSTSSTIEEKNVNIFSGETRIQNQEKIEFTVSTSSEQEQNEEPYIEATSEDLLDQVINFFRKSIYIIFLGLSVLVRVIIVSCGIILALLWKNDVNIAMIQSLSFSSTSLKPCQEVQAVFTIKNLDAEPAVLDDLGIGVRLGKDWSGKNFDFPGEKNLRLGPYGTHTFFKKHLFCDVGDYFAEPVVKINGSWGGIPPFTRVEFKVSS